MPRPFLLLMQRVWFQTRSASDPSCHFHCLSLATNLSTTSKPSSVHYLITFCILNSNVLSLQPTNRQNMVVHTKVCVLATYTGLETLPWYTLWPTWTTPNFIIFQLNSSPIAAESKSGTQKKIIAINVMPNLSATF